MKLFKNPLFAVVFCLLIVVVSSLINAEVGLGKKNERLGNQLCREVIEFAGENGLDSLQAEARGTMMSGDYRSLIASFSEAVAGLNDYDDVDDVDDAILRYTRFLRSTEKFPAKLFVRVLNMSF